MKNMLKFTALLLAFLWIFSLAGCNGNTPPVQDDAGKMPDGAGQADNQTPEIDQTDVDSEIFFKTPENAVNFVSLAVGENADVYAATYEGTVSRYTPEGELVREYPGTEFFCALQYTDGFLYGFNANTKDIVRLDPESGELQVLYAELDAVQLSAMAVVGSRMYLIAVPPFGNSTFDTTEDYYTNYGEKFFVLDMESGELAEITKITHPMTLYGNSKGALYVYAHPEDSYILYQYDMKTQMPVEIANMDDVGYLFSFACEGDSFVYLSATGGVNAKKMPDGLVYNVADILPVTYNGICFAYHKGNFIFLELNETNKDENNMQLKTIIHTLSLSSEYVTLLDHTTPCEIEPLGNITISVLGSNIYFNEKNLYENSGIKAVFVEQPQDLDKLQEFYTSLMAGDETVDIYVLGAGLPAVNTLMKQKGYEPLNDSKTIRTYIENAFDWVGENMTAPNGDIWMFPLYYRMEALWFVPENFELYDLTATDVATFDSYYKTVEKLNTIHSEHKVFARDFSSAEYNWVVQYESIYNDYDSRKINFTTDIFRNFFDKIWTGWSLTKGELHPILEKNTQLDIHINSSSVFPEYDAETVVFSLMNIRDQLTHVQNIEKWRALPLPRITSEVTSNIADSYCAVVNPYSKNKELAIAYLEAAAEDVLSSMKQPNFTLKDLSSYEGYYDMTIPVYHDIYELFKNGGTYSICLPHRERMNIIYEYQHGNLTLDEAIAEIQRKAEFMAGE